MKLFRSLLMVIPAACLLAQTPPARPAAPASAQPVPAPKPAAPTLLPAPPPAPAVPPDRVVIKVGNISITAAQFDMLVDMLPEQARASARGPGRKQFADNVVRVLALANEARRRGLDQTPAFKMQAEFQLDNFLAGLAFTQVSRERKVTEEEERQYYNEHKQDFDMVSARHILVRFKGSSVPVRSGSKDLSEEEALAKAQDLRKRVVAGENFATLAKAESDDVGSGANGGDLGSFGHGQMVPAFDTAAYAMKPGEISEPVKTQFGYHIIRVEGRETKTFEEARPDIDRRLAPTESQKALEDLVNKINPVLDPDFFNTAKQ